MTADRAAENLVRMMEDTEVPFGVRAKIAQDLLDRAGLIATQVHQIIPTTEDPVMRFFEGAFSDPNNWVSSPTPAIESYANGSLDQHNAEPEEISDAEIVEPEGEPVAQVDGRLEQHLVVPDQPHAVSPVSRLHRRNLIMPVKDYRNLRFVGVRWIATAGKRTP
jgi:hypothetical protein